MTTTISTNEIHFFGEMDIIVTNKPETIFKRACSIGEQCGYYNTIQTTSEHIINNFFGNNYEKISIFHDKKTKEFIKILDRTNPKNIREYNLNNLPKCPHGHYLGYFY